MSRTLAIAAEVLKLERLLGVDAGEFGFLDDVDPDELRTLREGTTDLLFDAGSGVFAKLGAAAKLLPSPLVATIAERAMGPLLCARAAGSVDPAKAIDVARRLSPEFLADTTVELDPRRVATIIGGVPTSLVEPVARELGRREEYVTMGRFLGFVDDAAIVAAMGALSDEAMLRTAFVLEHKDALDHAVSLLPPERLPGVLGCASENDLWPEALDLLDHLSEQRRGPIADVVASLDTPLVERLVSAVSQAAIWEALLPVVGDMSDDGRLQLVRCPALHSPDVLDEIVRAASSNGLWVDLVPLIRALPGDAVALLPGIVAGLPPTTLAEMLRQAVDPTADPTDTLVPLVDIVADMDLAERAAVITVLDDADRSLGVLLVETLTDAEHVRLLLDSLPADVLAAVGRAADRVGLRTEYDAAVASARAG